MVVEDPLFERPRIELAVLAQLERDLGKALGLAGGVQSVEVGFDLVDANVGVEERRGEKEEERHQSAQQRQTRQVADPAHAPPSAPSRDDAVEDQVNEQEAEHQYEPEKENRLVDVVQSVVADLVSHDGFDLRE